MGQEAARKSALHLRVVTRRLAATSPAQLPAILPSLVDTLLKCGDIISYSPSSADKSRWEGSEPALLCHKFKVQLSSFLQDKRPECRWTAAVLIKTTMEIGGWEVLRAAGPWARQLVALLSKSNPTITKKVVILALVRIFSATRGQQSLAREITTPLLPPFITACLNLIKGRSSSQDRDRPNVASPILPWVLEAFAKLLSHHPATFRPFLGQLKGLLGHIVSPTPSNEPVDGDRAANFTCPSYHTILLGQNLRALLPYAAPKNASTDAWAQSIESILSQMTRTIGKVYRAVVDEKRPRLTNEGLAVASESYAEPPHDIIQDDFSLPGWTGIKAGGERLEGLCQLLQAYLTCSTSADVSIPIGSIFPVLTRILNILDPGQSGQKISASAQRFDAEVSREEQDLLLSLLSGLHTTVLETLTVLIRRVGITSRSLAVDLLENCIWLLDRWGGKSKVQLSIYHLIYPIISCFGPSFQKSTVKSLSPLIITLTQEMLRCHNEGPDQTEGKTGGNSEQENGASRPENADSYLRSLSDSRQVKDSKPATDSITIELLCAIITSVPAHLMSEKDRAQLDRCAILISDKGAMLASVFNPPKSSKGHDKASILPFLARAYPATQEVEALLRPRFPLLQGQFNGNEGIEEDDDEEETRVLNLPFTTPQNEQTAPMPGLDHEASDAITKANITPEQENRASSQLNISADGTARLPENKDEVNNQGSESNQSSKRPYEIAIGNEASAEDVSLEVTKKLRPIEDKVEEQPEESISSQQPHTQEGARLKEPERVFSSTQDQEFLGDKPRSVEHGDSGSESDFEIPPIIVDSSSEEIENENVQLDGENSRSA